MMNSRSRRNSSSRYVGVDHRTDTGAFRAYVTLHGQTLFIGNYDDELEAAWMRDQFALALHGEFAHLNFDYVKQEVQNESV